MAFDHENHAIDPVTGFHVHKETGARVGLDPLPHLPVSHDPDWPKWVVPHASHVVVKRVDGAPDHVSTPGWPQFHVNRASGEVTVLVANEDEEKRALGALEEKKDDADEKPADEEDEVRDIYE